MGERRRDRTSKRRRTVLRGAQKSCSDTEVAQDRRIKSKDSLPWPKAIQTLTVDQLARYRRRRIQDGPRDTLGFCRHGERDQVFENLVTEYRRAFRATSEDSLLREDPLKIAEDFVEAVGEDTAPDVKLMETNLEASQLPGHGSRPDPTRREVILKRRGEFYGDTEYSNYKSHEGIHRAELLRRPTSLKMEGNIETMTEKCEKFIQWLNVSRPELARIPTHLKMEGQLETSTENHDQYVPFVGARRPDLLRQPAHLRLEGESCFLPEYTDVFRPHPQQERRMPKWPECHLKTGELNKKTESQKFVDPRGTVPPGETEDSQRQNKEEDMNMLVSKLEDMKGPPLGVPEYIDAYKDFPRERPKLCKPENEIGLSDGSKVLLSTSPTKFSTKIDQDPEYKSKYVDKNRPQYRRHPGGAPRLPVGSSGFGKRIVPDLRHQYEPTSEVRSQYVPYGHVPRVEMLRMPVNLRPEGHMDLQPEYRDAYCSSKASEPQYRRRNRSLSASRRRENNWMSNNNGEQFGLVNAEDDQEAFQVLQTRVHDDSIVGKPPVPGRRASRASQLPRPSHLDVTGPLKNRSPSPSYRLHVSSEDDGDARGFANRRRSSSLHQKSPSPERVTFNDNYPRSYSPSFGRLDGNPQHNGDQQAFVVLENTPGVVNKVSDNRRRRFGHSDVEVSRRDRTSTSWMPPWYDNTSTI